jgi:hypothetical protein
LGIDEKGRKDMELWLIIILAIAVIIGLIFHIKIYINLKYQRDDSNDYLSVNVYVLKSILAYSMQIPIIRITGLKSLFWLDSKIKTGQRQAGVDTKREQRFVRKSARFYMNHPRKLQRIAKQFYHHARLYCYVMDKFIHSLHCEQLHWKTVYGSQDAAITGIGAGMLWTVKSLIIARLNKHVIVTQKPVICVDPIFGHNSFKVDFQCIFSIRLGNVINAMRILYIMKQ